MAASMAIPKVVWMVVPKVPTTAAMKAILSAVQMVAQ
jgi:hypothetical protein